MSAESYRILEDAVVQFLRTVATTLPDDVLAALKRAYEEEEDPLARKIYETYLENVRIAEERGVPLCQDTGAVMFFLRAGTEFPYLHLIPRALTEGTRRATFEVPLRHNCADPFTKRNTGDNVGTGIPFIDVELLPDEDHLEIYCYLAGGGTSLPGRAKVLTPAEFEGYAGLLEFVIETMKRYAPNACPPQVVGIGIGTTAETAALLSKKALLREIGSRNPRKEVAELENLLKERLNNLRLGPQGLGGKISVLDVFVEYSFTHPATRGIAINLGCWAHRKGLMTVNSDLSFSIPSHSRRKVEV
ncbi:MAG: L(+)-tartrate dehydratase alpha subunit [Archaeoglobi archaeon]|nr:fumarate hydratase [Candidatus Mnemosynella bozhongmuii]MDI3502252.1 L(+)-tartrate dehydratase alpha subunit [Archaeoglobi archaeon]MDK2781958.1 L(+)-tartrate dehydratase alpha subunit [Archaeoglobi archaeon]